MSLEEDAAAAAGMELWEDEAAPQTHTETESATDKDGNPLAVVIAEEESISKLTSECPPPPFYYKYFASATQDNEKRTVAPPRLQDLDTTGLEAEGGDEVVVAAAAATAAPLSADTLQRLALRKRLYGGTVNLGHQQHQCDNERDYKAAILSGLDSILQVSLGLASEVPPQQTPEVVVLRMHEELRKMHDLLGQYRHHEGRERLLALSRKEIQELEGLAATMDTLLDEPLPS